MKIVITGGGGFLGFKLAKALLARGRLMGPDGREQEIAKIVLLDGAFPAALPKDARLEAVAGDVSDARDVERWVETETGLIVREGREGSRPELYRKSTLPAHRRWWRFDEPMPLIE